ncbi:hypothetical protein EYC98_07280 [Halieaceae bacterium IMCC14734]|uniref:DUF2306 domain-containing protein n=1 Tax=Candidatus Litorirhabdus singularis TaxID=2518993 RepID=A0ABT3TEE0_9GAMM|nr:hypothetical protein [Candidatus Litorirhabdus singularis]MCX2980678.1 hypothetical protein [Candidatus Litorirhabdus singularis]
MPEMILLGWIHTIIAIAALIAGYYTLAVYKVIKPDQLTGRVYLICTFLAAATALMIYQRGAFGPAHALAVLTLLALAAGFLVTRISALSKIADYFQAFCFSGTLLFHMIPAITDGLLRLPIGDPVLTNPEAPLLKMFYLSFVAVFIVGWIFQCYWLNKNSDIA